MGLKIKILSKTELNTMSLTSKLAAKAAAASAASTSARPATATISGGSVAPKSADSPKADAPKAPKKDSAPKECEAFKAGTTCKFGSGCRDARCKAEQAKSPAKSSAPAKAAGGGGAEIAGLRKEVAVLTDLVKAGFEKQSDQTSKLSDTVVTGFAAQREANERLQLSIEAMMDGIGLLAKTLEGGITSRRSVPELPVPSESSTRRKLPALPAPPPEELDSDSDSESDLENFGRVAKNLRDCPLNSAVKSLIPSFVLKYPSLNSDALACLLLAILSGKKVSDFKKMGEFTRTKVMPLLTKDNHKIFQKFFAKLAPECKSDSCVSVKNAKGTDVSYTFHILGKEDGEILHIIRILREEE